MRRIIKNGTLKFTLLLIAVLLLFPSAVRAAERSAEYKTKTESYTFDEDDGLNLEDTDITEMFTATVVRAAGGEAAVKDGYVEMSQYAGLYSDIDISYDYLSGLYSFTVDYDTVGNNPALGGIFVRMTDPSAYSVTNPMNSNVQQFFSLYEWDWYKENRGKEKGISSIGGSGIRVYKNNPAGKIGIAVKTRTEDGLFVFSQGVELPYPEGFNESGFNQFRIDDDGISCVIININDVLFATVEYGGEPGTYPDGDDGDSDLLFYKHAVIKNAAGEQLLEVDNARISARYSILGIGNRGDHVTKIDSVKISYLTKVKDNPTKAPATEVPEVTDAPAATDAPKTDGTVSDPTSVPARETEAPGKTDSSGGGLVWLYAVCGVIAAAAVAVIIIYAVKGKKK